MRSVDLLNKVVRKATNQISDKLGWPFAWSVWVAARYLIALRYTTGNNELQTTDTLALFVGFLDRMGRIWQISATYARLLRQTISELSQGTIPEQASVLELMADMRASISFHPGLVGRIPATSPRNSWIGALPHA